METKNERWLRAYNSGVGSGIPLGDCNQSGYMRDCNQFGHLRDCNQFGHMRREQWGHCDTGDCHDNGRYPHKVFVEVPPQQGSAGTSHHGNCDGGGKGWG